MAHHFQELAKMDLKTPLNESDSFKRMMDAQSRSDQLHEHLGVSSPEELERILKPASLMPYESAAASTELEAQQMLENALGLRGLATHNAQTAADLMRVELKKGMDAAGLTGSDPDAFAEQVRSTFGKASGVLDGKNLGDLDGYARIDFDEIDRQEKERHQQQMLEMSQGHARRMADDAAEFRRRENTKLEYARRQAEASEAALEAEKARTAEAREDAERAREEVRISRRHMRISLWIAGASMLLAAWTLLKDQIS